MLTRRIDEYKPRPLLHRKRRSGYHRSVIVRLPAFHRSYAP